MTVCQNSPYKPVAPGRTHKQTGSLGGISTHTWSFAEPSMLTSTNPSLPALNFGLSHCSPQPHPPLALPGALLSAKGTCPSPQPRCYRALVSPSPSFQLATLRNSTKSELCQVARCSSPSSSTLHTYLFSTLYFMSC